MSTTNPAAAAPSRPGRLVEKTTLGVIAGAAAAIGITELVFLTLRIVHLLTSAQVTLRDVLLADPVEVPFASPSVVSSEAPAVDLVVEGLAVGDRAYLVVAAVLASALTVGICAVVVWLCVRVFLGRPFVGSVTWGIGVVAILVIAAGLGVPMFTGLAHAEASLALGLEETPPFLVEVDLAPIGWGIGLAVIAGAFEIGQRMQRDQDGLV